MAIDGVSAPPGSQKFSQDAIEHLKSVDDMYSTECVIHKLYPECLAVDMRHKGQRDTVRTVLIRDNLASPARHGSENAVESLDFLPPCKQYTELLSKVSFFFQNLWLFTFSQALSYY